MKKIAAEKVTFYTICSAFVIGWFFAFALQTFFNTKGTMIELPTIPSMQPIGYDLKMTIGASIEYINDKTPYYLETYSYPPFSVIFFLPFITIPHQFAFAIFFLFTSASLIAGLFLISRLIQEKKYVGELIVMFIVSGFLSYGMHFELERGQFNLIALIIAVLGIFLFYRNKIFCGLMLVSIAAQLKIYPGIFFLLFFFTFLKNRQNIWPLIITGILNFALLFILGYRVFLDFFNALLFQVKNPYIWEGNHSLIAYCSGAVKHSLCTHELYPGLLVSVLIAIGLVGLLYFKYEKEKFSLHLFSVCGLALLLIPSASHDYTLSMLPLFLFPLTVSLVADFITSKEPTFVILLFGTLFLYTVLIFSPYQSSLDFHYFENKAPALYLLIVITVFSTLKKQEVHIFAIIKKIRNYHSKFIAQRT